jgi:paraquat-inducible protein A
LPGHHSAAGQSGQNAAGLKAFLARILFHLKTWGMAEIFLAGVLVSFVKLMAYGDIGIGLSFIPWCMFCLLQLRTFQCVDRRWLWDDIAPMPAITQPLKVGVPDPPGAALLLCCTAVLPADQTVCPRCHTKERRGVKTACSGRWRCW